MEVELIASLIFSDTYFQHLHVEPTLANNILAESRNTSRAIKRAFKDVWLGGIRVARVRDRVRDRIRERSC